MILWGSNGRLLNLGRLDERECSNCGRVQPFQLSLSYKFFCLYWIFRLGVCAAEERRHYISTLSAVYPQHTVGLMA